MNNLQKILLASSVALVGLGAQAQTAKDTITDAHIIYPSSFDTNVKNLQDNWYLQRYAVLDEKAQKAKKATPTDEVYVARLQALPNIIEMPFNSVVRQYIEMYAEKKPQLVEKMLGMSLYYMPIFEEALESENMPLELKYLAVVESALNPNAVSKAGATGLWQFMSGTATGEGLEVNSLVDERRDPIASSKAAAQYLKKLFNIYGDWTLAIASYNCGPGNVNKAIARSGGQKDYWAIYPFLPAETRGYVPAFIAANYIMNYYAEHGISHALARRPITTDTVHVNKAVHFQQISDVLGLPMEEIRILNPQYRQDIIPGHIRPYALILPSVQAYCYVANEDSIINHDRDKYISREYVEPSDGTMRTDAKGQYIEELVVKKHVVKKGETLKSIAAKYGVTVESIRKANKMNTSKVKRGTTLKINTYQRKYNVPVDTVAVNQNDIAQNVETADSAAIEAPKKEPAKPAATKKEPAKKETAKKKDTKQAAASTTYVVKKGDSLYRIATKHGITTKQLKDANGLRSDNIQVGQKLKIPK